MQNTKLFKVNLQLFNDGAAAGGEGGATAGAAVQGAENALPKADKSGSSRRKSGALSNVVYGIQEDALGTETTIPAAGGVEGNDKSGVTTTSDAREAKRAKFKELVEGEYKDEFSEMFQQSFNRRFRDVKGMETSLSEQKPILDMLMQRYKITDGDMSKLQAAVEDDTQYWEEAAEEAGLTVEQYKAMQKLERENEELRKIRRQQLGQQQAQAQLDTWYKEAEALKTLYPSFDFKAEATNREFLGLLRSGISVQQAYELVHMDEIKEAAAKSAAQATGAQFEARIKSKQSRPTENGTSSQSAAIVKNDVANLTAADRAEIARRVQRGEKIRF